jgi:hypothetical protein
VFAARYELNSYIVFRKRLVSKRLSTTLIRRLHGFQTKSPRYREKKIVGARCSVVVKALYYKPESRGLETR